MNEESPSEISEPKSLASGETRKWRIRALLLVLTLILAWGFFSPKHYKGHTLTEWLHDVGKDQPWLGADEIILSAGPREIPRYLKMLEAEDSALQLRLIEMANKLPLIDIEPFTAEQKEVAALYALKTLGPAADRAYQTVLKLLDNEDCNVAVPGVLASMRPTDFTGFRIAIKHSNSLICGLAVNWIAETIFFDGATELPIDDLLIALDDDKMFVREWTISALGLIADSNHQVRRALERLAKDPDPELRIRVQQYLDRILFKERLIERTEGVLAEQIESLFTAEQQTHLKRALEELNLRARYSYREKLRSLEKADCDPGIPWLLACLHPKQFESLNQALQHPNPEVKRNAVGAVWLTVAAGDIPPPIPILLRTLKDPDAQIRKISAIALARAAATNTKVRAALELRRNDAAPDVRSATIQILNMTNPQTAPE